MRRIQIAIACVAVAVAMAGQLQAAIVTEINSSVGFFDNTSGTRDFDFVIGDFGGESTVVTDVNLSIYFAKSNDNSEVPEGSPITPGIGYFGEIEFALTSPSGTVYTLISNPNGIELVPADNFSSFNSGSDGFKGTILFDQSAPTAVNADPNVISAGTFRPDDATLNSLDIFNGELALGTWTLFIEDDVGADGLSFYEASLTITTSSVPEPSSLALLCIGACVAGVGAARRHRRVKAPKATA